MNKSELLEVLTKKGVPSDTYSLNGKLYPDRFEIRVCDSEWIVYYCDERGEKHDLRVFNNEEEACDYFYDYVSNNSYMSQFFR